MVRDLMTSSAVFCPARALVLIMSISWFLHPTITPQNKQKKQTVCVSFAENSSNWNFEGKWYYTAEWYILTGNNLEVHISTNCIVSCSALLRLSTPIVSNNQPNNLVSFSVNMKIAQATLLLFFATNVACFGLHRLFGDLFNPRTGSITHHSRK